MLSELKSDSRVVGAKQVLRAIEGGRARQVFIARDADPRITEQVERLCREREIAVEATASMRELGAACSIAVGAAVAALVR